MTLTLLPALVSDTSALVTIHTAAFRSDLFSALMLLNRPEGSHQVMIRRSVDEWFANPKAQIIKALDEDGDILGWACWISEDAVEYPPPTTEETKSSIKETEAIPAPVLDSAPKPNLEPSRVLGGLMWAEQVKYENTHLQGKRRMVLQALVTSPSCQGRGVGTQLVECGAQPADAEGLMCWAHASPPGFGLHAKAVFEEVAKSDFDLSEWALGGKSGGRGWVSLFFALRGK